MQVQRKRGGMLLGDVAFGVAGLVEVREWGKEECRRETDAYWKYGPPLHAINIAPPASFSLGLPAPC